MIVGLAGYAQSGKDTVAGILVHRFGFRRLAFADALKAVALRVDPLIAMKVAEHGWEHAKRDLRHRLYLQNLGLAVREECGENVWVDAVMRQIGPADDVVISDVRFPNEAQAVVDRAGEVWRVERPGIVAPNDHISEHALADWQYSRFVHNDGSLLDLVDHVVTIYRLALDDDSWVRTLTATVTKNGPEAVRRIVDAGEW